MLIPNYFLSRIHSVRSFICVLGWGRYWRASDSCAEVWRCQPGTHGYLLYTTRYKQPNKTFKTGVEHIKALVTWLPMVLEEQTFFFIRIWMESFIFRLFSSEQVRLRARSPPWFFPILTTFPDRRNTTACCGSIKARQRSPAVWSSLMTRSMRQRKALMSPSACPWAANWDRSFSPQESPYCPTQTMVRSFRFVSD